MMSKYSGRDLTISILGVVLSRRFDFYFRGEPDELLAHIDDMLADLNTELDFMIPGTDV